MDSYLEGSAGMREVSLKIVCERPSLYLRINGPVTVQS